MTTIAAAIWPTPAATPSKAIARGTALAMVGACLITLSAKTQVPFWPVPFTLQTLAISVIAAAYGLRLGLATIGLYLIAGFLGAPVFANPGAGPAYFAGQTTGFLAGFVLMTAIIGAAADKGWDRTFASLVAVMSLANVIVFLPGLLWLGLWVGYGEQLMGIGQGFVVGTAVKTALACALMPLAWAIVARWRS